MSGRSCTKFEYGTGVEDIVRGEGTVDHGLPETSGYVADTDVGETAAAGAAAEVGLGGAAGAGGEAGGGGEAAGGKAVVRVQAIAGKHDCLDKTRRHYAGKHP